MEVLCNQIECDAFTCENTNNWGCCQNECAKLGVLTNDFHLIPPWIDEKTGCTKLLGCDKRNTCQLATDPSGCEKCECEPVELEVVYDYYDPADYMQACPALNGCSKKKRKSCKYGWVAISGILIILLYQIDLFFRLQVDSRNCEICKCQKMQECPSLDYCSEKKSELTPILTQDYPVS